MSGEFEFLKNLKERFNLSRLGDDCAVLPLDATHDQVLTTDLLIEDIDFQREWITPEILGRKALAASLSDIAAMGAVPAWTMVSLGMPADLWEKGFADRLLNGFMDLAAEFEVELVGGDVSKTNGLVVADCIAAGKVEKGMAVWRGGARPGDLVFVSGPLGGSAAGLQILLGNGDANASGSAGGLISKHLEPAPQVSLGMLLNKQRLATAMIDISDGLSSDLRHLCEASVVGARVEAERIPVDPGASDMAGSGLLNKANALDLALHGGEGYQLLFTVAPENSSRAESFDAVRIGKITNETGSVLLVRGGSAEDLRPLGYRHF